MRETYSLFEIRQILPHFSHPDKIANHKIPAAAAVPPIITSALKKFVCPVASTWVLDGMVSQSQSFSKCFSPHLEGWLCCSVVVDDTMTAEQSKSGGGSF